MEIIQIGSGLAKALVKAQTAFEAATKDADNTHFRSKYADLGNCVNAVKDALNSNGIFYLQRTKPHDSGVIVETVFIHESGEQLSAGELYVPAQKHDPQGFGSALTYARRYSLLAATGIAPEDDDGNAASKPPKAPQAPQTQGMPASRKADILTLIRECTNRDELNKVWLTASSAADAANDRAALDEFKAACQKMAGVIKNA